MNAWGIYICKNSVGWIQCEDHKFSTLLPAVLSDSWKVYSCGHRTFEAQQPNCLGGCSEEGEGNTVRREKGTKLPFLLLLSAEEEEAEVVLTPSLSLLQPPSC